MKTQNLSRKIETSKAIIFIDVCPSDNKRSYTVHKKMSMFGCDFMSDAMGFFNTKKAALKFSSTF